MALQNNSIMPMREYLSKTLYIPMYQREYSWDEVELDDFWKDLVTTKQDREVHFFGQIVIHNEDDKKLYVIDGQQRTITSVIYLRALQKICSENAIIKDTEDAKSIVDDIASLIGRNKRRSNELHLILGNDDKDYFINKIQSGYPAPDRKEKKKSRERLRKAFLFFEAKLSDELADITDEDDLLDRIESFFKAFKDDFRVLYMEATKLNEAFIIFETLNARGKDLETADLLKNYFFSHTKNIKLAEEQWSLMIKELDGIDPTKFIRHLWNSGHDFSREKELYKEIVKTISTPKRSKEFLNELAKYATVYHDLANPTDCNYFTNEKIKESLVSLKNMHASSFYPIVLALTSKDFSEPDMADIVESIEIFVFRNFTIGGKVANSAEVDFSKIAKSISEEELTTKEDIQAKVRANMLDDAEFKNLFTRWRGSNSAADKFAVRYILRRIHSYLSPTSEVTQDYTKVHIEHIMPQNGSLWTSVSEDDHDAYLWRLGNLALLDSTLNKEAQNKPFASKKANFATSQIRPNEDIANKEDWGINEIEARQKQLAVYALKIWK